MFTNLNKKSSFVTHLRIDNVVHQGVDAILLIVPDNAHRLFAHSTLVRVARTLIVMWIGNKTCAYTEQRKWFDLQMRCLLLVNTLLVVRDKRVVLLVDVQILDQTWLWIQHV